MNLKKVHFLLCILLIFSAVTPCLYAKIMVISSKDGQALSSFYVTSSLNHFKNQLVNDGANDGWGIVAYRQNGTPIAGSSYLYNPTTNTYTITPNAYRFASSRDIAMDTANFDAAVNTIISNNPRLIIIHSRDATEAPYNVVDPQPLVFNKNNRYYTFVHHGSISNATEIDNFTNSIDNTIISQMKNTNNLVAYNYNSLNLFAYVMAQFQNENFQAMHALKEMMRHSIFNAITNNKTYVLADGFQSYAYSPGGNYYLSSNIVYNNSTQPYFVTNCSGNLILGLDPSGNETIIPLSSSSANIAYVPINGRPTEHYFYNYSVNQSLLGIASMNRCINLSTNWKWESFPIRYETNGPIASVQAFNNATLSYWQGTGSRPPSNYLKRDLNNTWVTDGLYTLNFTNGHKIYYPNPTYSFASSLGNILPENSSVNIPANTKTWVGYWLMDRQTLASALGEHLDKVANVYGERWHYQEQSSNTKTDPFVPNPDPNSLIMEFGKSYIIELKAGESIPAFAWCSGSSNTRSDVIEYSNTSEPEYFDYIDQADYETIMIANINVNDQYDEIAVYAGEDCIGATKVTSYPVQILAYTGLHQGQALSFRAVCQNRKNQEILLNSEVISNQKDNVLIAGEFAYAGVNLYPKSQTSSLSHVSQVCNISAYPNPFNPSTSIKFTLIEKQMVSIEIYNIKGQKEKNLINQELNNGTHAVVWDGKNESSQTVSNGVYYFKISTPFETKIDKILLLK